MSIKSVSIAAILVAATVVPAHSHPGGLDAKGGHFNKKTGEYHYHRQPPPQPAPAPAVERTAAAAAFPASAAVSTIPPTLDQVTAALSNCMTIQDGTRRLWCFEGVANALAR